MSLYQTTYGIIGNPVTHSLSPLMHNAAFEALNVEAVYELFPLEEFELDDFFEKLRDKSSPIFGLNVTVPYKEKVLRYMDSCTPLADKIGAVNTIVITDDRKFMGYNTDAAGFMAHLEEFKFNTKDKTIAILGAGGSARAILTTLCIIPERPRTIKIYNRTISRADSLIASLQGKADTSNVKIVMNVEDLNIELADLLINTTSIGMKKNDPCLINEEYLHSQMLVYDLIYSPRQTLLLKMAKKHGAQTANGLGMLYYQGVLAFQHWAQTELDDSIKNIMREALEGGVK